jgi:hypothetical protein
LSHSTSPICVMGISKIGLCGTICLGWLPTMILLISASWVARITGVSHRGLALVPAIIPRLTIILTYFYSFLVYFYTKIYLAILLKNINSLMHSLLFILLILFTIEFRDCYGLMIDPSN